MTMSHNHPFRIREMSQVLSVRIALRRPTLNLPVIPTKDSPIAEPQWPNTQGLILIQRCQCTEENIRDPMHNGTF
jgi:hypothetical protein